ncbi:hypothetical protein NA57DRAFT_74818 [Rhizodiscina lignyota]|uniref:Uncharacterized protein n=1 Tax=Rhizodiscina lignyota TaxID=1504668 RepID=A0A9P4IIX5_9PEZI|nr:hypothetical protein NA57DRAFT_74818 [Rhizodiscina lignyota]
MASSNREEWLDLVNLDDLMDDVGQPGTSSEEQSTSNQNIPSLADSFRFPLNGHGLDESDIPLDDASLGMAEELHLIAMLDSGNPHHQPNLIAPIMPLANTTWPTNIEWLPANWFINNVGWAQQDHSITPPTSFEETNQHMNGVQAPRNYSHSVSTDSTSLPTSQYKPGLTLPLRLAGHPRTLLPKPAQNKTSN